jgi:hypothetical protein
MWAPKLQGKFSTARLPQRTTFRNFILLAQLQIALPPDWNAIILAHKVGIGPGVPDHSTM